MHGLSAAGISICEKSIHSKLDTGEETSTVPSHLSPALSRSGWASANWNSLTSQEDGKSSSLDGRSLQFFNELSSCALVQW